MNVSHRLLRAPRATDWISTESESDNTLSDLDEGEIRQILTETEVRDLLQERGISEDMPADPDVSSLVSKPSPTKLSGMGNYRTWAKDLEMVLIRMGCW